jgi:phage shock protein C
MLNRAFQRPCEESLELAAENVHFVHQKANQIAMEWTWRWMVETRVFGVCSYLGEKMGIAGRRIRLYFIYATFLTFGSPVVIYLATAFWINLRDYLKERILPVWDA